MFLLLLKEHSPRCLLRSSHPGTMLYITSVHLKSWGSHETYCLRTRTLDSSAVQFEVVRRVVPSTTDQSGRARRFETISTIMCLYLSFCWLATRVRRGAGTQLGAGDESRSRLGDNAGTAKWASASPGRAPVRESLEYCLGPGWQLCAAARARLLAGSPIAAPTDRRLSAPPWPLRLVFGLPAHCARFPCCRWTSLFRSHLGDCPVCTFEFIRKRLHGLKMWRVQTDHRSDESFLPCDYSPNVVLTKPVLQLLITMFASEILAGRWYLCTCYESHWFLPCSHSFELPHM